jgi:hypothetical protein
MDSSDFYGGMKDEEDKTKEWTDAAQFFVDIRRPKQQEPEKVAGVGDVVKQIAQSAWRTGKNLDPSGVLRGVTGSRAGAIAGLGGAALFGIGTALQSRGRKELGGQSKLEHSLRTKSQEAHASPEPAGFGGKMKNHLLDLSANVASTARKHPVVASLVGGLGGAKAGLSVLNRLSRKA